MNDSMTIKVGRRGIFLNRRKESPDGEVIFQCLSCVAIDCVINWN